MRPDVPLRVLFAALDRYTELLRPVLDDEPAPARGPAAAESEAMVLPVDAGTAPHWAPGPTGVTIA